MEPDSPNLGEAERGADSPTPEPEVQENVEVDGEYEEVEEEEEIPNDDAHLTVPYPHIFAIGDAADAYGAIKAGHTAYYQVCSLFNQ